MKFNIKETIQFIIYDPIRKIVALLFSFGLWFFVAIDNNYQYEKELKIIYTNLPDSLMLVEATPNLKVTLSGRGGALLSTWAAPPKARCDLDQMRIGENIIPVKKLIIPLGFSEISLHHTNNAIKVTLDKKMTKKVKINVPFKVALTAEYSVSDINVLDTVELTGPAGIVANLKEISAETLYIKNKKTSFLTKVELDTPDDNINISKKQIGVEIKIEKTMKKTFVKIPLKLIFTPKQNIFSEKIMLDTLIVEGPVSKVSRLRKKDISVKIQLTKLSTGDYELPATIVLPDYIKPIYSKPAKFQIKIY